MYLLMFVFTKHSLISKKYFFKQKFLDFILFFKNIKCFYTSRDITTQRIFFRFGESRKGEHRNDTADPHKIVGYVPNMSRRPRLKVEERTI